MSILRTASAAAVLLCLPIVSISQAGPSPALTWDGGGANASWGTAANWGGSNALPSFNGTETITVGDAFGSGTTLTLNGNRYVNALVISTTTGFTIASGTGGTLNLRSGDITRQDVSQTEATQTISAGIVLGDPTGVAAYTGTFNIAGSNGLVLSGDISQAGGSRGINLTGGSWLQLSGTNTFSGGLTATQGIIYISADANMGASSGGLTLSGGTLEFQGSFTTGRSINFTAASGLYVDAGYTVELTGAISGNGGLVAGFASPTGGTLILSGTGSSGTGYTQVWNNSVLSLRGTVSLGSGVLQLASGGVLELGNGNFTRALGTGNGQVNMGVTAGGSGFAAWGADRVVNLGGSGATVIWGSGGFVATGGAFYLGSATSNATVDFQNGLDLAGAARTITLTKGTGTGAEGKISGVISGSAAASALVVTSTNNGRLLLSNGNNSYAGTTTVNSGALWLGANATSGAGNTVLGSSSTAVSIGNTAAALDASLLSAAPITVSRNLSVVTGNTGVTTIGGATADASTFSGTITLGSTTANGHSLTLSAVSGGTVTVSGVIADFAGITGAKGTVTKSGAGIVNLTNANTYAGGTTVTAGCLFANNSTGSATGTGSVSVSNSGTVFGGTGTVSGAVSVASGAKLCPGASGDGSTSILRTGALTLASGANFDVDLNNTTAGSGYDQLSVTGAVNLGGALASNLVVTAGGSLTIGQKFFVLLNDSSDAVTGTFAQGTSVTATNGDIFTINYADNGDGTANDISLTFTAVPEPRTFLPGILGLAVIAGRFVKRTRRRL
jgi:autotransporter-associated beta strand protein